MTDNTMDKGKKTKGQEKFEDTKGVIRSRKSKNDRQYNGQKKKGNNNLQSTTQKTKNQATQTPLKTQVLQKDKQFLFHMWHLSCYSCYKPGDKP